ncbi:hypothetical protein [Serinibacter salmoneus]|uniref:Uncharacterized protein n=1 Tax=Serinibacter salmoneus TaxID=556530 RepID=A0A2A9D1X7_9MICO|nr:hypothetical protein [Serinibacter salmoneus]PFG19859.1 hypothetical protein ATL40_1435 [Serinibacter salmoneus]
MTRPLPAVGLSTVSAAFSALIMFEIDAKAPLDFDAVLEVVARYAPSDRPELVEPLAEVLDGMLQSARALR